MPAVTSTFSDLTQSATGTVAAASSVAQVLAGVGQTAAGGVEVASQTLSQTLAGISQSADAANVLLVGEIASRLSDATQAVSASVPVRSEIVQTLNTLVQATGVFRLTSAKALQSLAQTAEIALGAVAVTGKGSIASTGVGGLLQGISQSVSIGRATELRSAATLNGIRQTTRATISVLLVPANANEPREYIKKTRLRWVGWGRRRAGFG